MCPASPVAHHTASPTHGGSEGSQSTSVISLHFSYSPLPPAILLCWFLCLETYFKPEFPASVLTRVGTPG